jgi:hypothetical protein
MPPDNIPRRNSAGFCESCGNSPVEVVSIARGYDVYFCSDCYQNALNHFTKQKPTEPFFTSVSVTPDENEFFATTDKGQIVRVIFAENKYKFWPIPIQEREAP